MIIRMKDQLSKQAVTGEITAFFFSLRVFISVFSANVFTERKCAISYKRYFFNGFTGGKKINQSSKNYGTETCFVILRKQHV